MRRYMAGEISAEEYARLTRERCSAPPEPPVIRRAPLRLRLANRSLALILRALRPVRPR